MGDMDFGGQTDSDLKASYIRAQAEYGTLRDRIHEELCSASLSLPTESASSDHRGVEAKVKLELKPELQRLHQLFHRINEIFHEQMRRARLNAFKLPAEIVKRPRRLAGASVPPKEGTW